MHVQSQWQSKQEGNIYQPHEATKESNEVQSEDNPYGRERVNHGSLVNNA
jgi:hypothetical protein